MKNTCINSCQNGYGTELASILQEIEEQTLIPADQMKAHFWDMFIVDALLGIQEMGAVLDDESEINRRVYKYPTSAMMDGGTKISYSRFIASLQNEGCNQALSGSPRGSIWRGLKRSFSRLRDC